MNESIYIGSWDDLKLFGINALTGEACAYGRRLLCDVNEDGAALMLDYLGVTMLSKNWNSTVAGKPAVASVMLHRDSCLQIAEFALTRAGAIAILYRNDGTMSGLFTQELVNSYQRMMADNAPEGWKLLTLIRSNAPQEGSRNVHQFSGRSV
jgi:hypothetical protein